MNKFNSPICFLFVSLLALTVSCEGTFRVAIPNNAIIATPTTPGLHLYNSSSDSPVSYDYPNGTSVEIPGRELSMENGSKIFVGWCSSLPCATLNDRTHLAGQRIITAGPLPLYALWIDPSPNWELPDPAGIFVPNGVTEIPDWKFSYGVPAYFPTVVISDSVTVIREYAFISIIFDHVIIPNSVTTLETGSLAMGIHTSIILPSSVTTVGGDYALGGGDLREITLGSNVSIAATDSATYDIKTFYDSNGRLAGKYTWNGSSWDYSP